MGQIREGDDFEANRMLSAYVGMRSQKPVQIGVRYFTKVQKRNRLVGAGRHATNTILHKSQKINKINQRITRERET